MHIASNKSSDQKYIYRPYMTINGVTYWAKNYGKKAFRIPVND